MKSRDKGPRDGRIPAANEGKSPPIPRVLNSRTRQQGLGYLIRLAHRAFVRDLANRLDAHQITTSQWTALRALWDEDNFSQIELAKRIHVEKASLTSVLDALEKRGLARRLPDLRDRRARKVQLTKAGRDLKKELLPYAAQGNALATRGFSKTELVALKGFLQRIIINLN